MDLDVPFVDLPFVVETAYFRRPDKKCTVILAAKIPGSQVAFMKKSGKHDTEFDFAWKLTDDKNHVAGGLRDTLPVHMTNDTYEEVIGSNLFYEGEITLPPGKYNLKVAVRENESGKIGTFEAPLVIPDISEPGLDLSSIVLSNEVKSSNDLDRTRVTHDKNSPLQVGDRSILPSVTRVFRTNQVLTVYLESYAGKNLAPAAPAVPPSVGLVFFRRGRKFAEAGPFPGKLDESPDQKVSYFAQVPLEKFPRGRYTLQVNVLDPAIERVAFARVPLAIVLPPPRNLPAGNGK
jgi:hypothetical protein